ncbi:Protein NipSnap 3A [Bulinus truncatus]|nr:Protein NipSnap 3A [Bulinus truncatus]
MLAAYAPKLSYFLPRFKVNNNAFKYLVRSTSTETQEPQERGSKEDRPHQDAPTPIYELRVYQIYPKEFRKVVELFQKHITVRTKHSKLLGFWNGEIGGTITQLVHIWEYDSLSHRRKVRNSMMDDKIWTTVFLPQLLPCMDTWTNCIMGLVPNTKLNLDYPPESGAVYLLEIVKNTDVSKKIISAIKGEHLVGRFVGALGSMCTEYRLWRYQTIDTLLYATWNRQLDMLHSGSHHTGGNSLLLYPPWVLSFAVICSVYLRLWRYQTIDTLLYATWNRQLEWYFSQYFPIMLKYYIALISSLSVFFLSNGNCIYG